MTFLSNAIRRLLHLVREQAARENQAQLNYQLEWRRPHGIMRPGHLRTPAWATSGAASRADDPLEQLWRLPARRPRRR